MMWIPGVATGVLAIGLIAAATPELPFRSLVIAASLLSAPGLAIGSVAGIRDSLVLAMVTVPISVAVNSLVATAFVYVGIWTTEVIYASVALITVAAAWLGTHERSARVTLLAIAALPAVLLVAAQLARGAS